MRDWKRYVRSRLRLPELKGQRRERIVEELALQIDDLYREALRGGASEEEAARDALEQVGDWEELTARIAEAERPNVVSASEPRPASSAWSMACC